MPGQPLLTQGVPLWQVPSGYTLAQQLESRVSDGMWDDDGQVPAKHGV